MTSDDYLRSVTSQLIDSGILTARLDALLFLELVLRVDKAKILAHPETALTKSQIASLDKLVQSRKNHIPVAQITKKCEFYGRSFYVDNRVLQPRPESETIIDLLKKIVKSDHLGTQYIASKLVLKDGLIEPDIIRIADIGTGSGALGITAQLELQSVVVDLIDIDKDALKVAKKNVDLHTMNLRVMLGDLVSDLDCNYQIIISNLPYVPDDYKLNKAAMHEPPLAIFGGQDGLDVYRRFFRQLTKLHHRPLYILTECFPENQQQLSAIAAAAGYSCRLSEDFAQLFEANITVTI